MKLQHKAYKENEAEFKEQNLPENKIDRMLKEKCEWKQGEECVVTGCVYNWPKKERVEEMQRKRGKKNDTECWV